MNFHKLADTFPMMNEKDYAELKADIAKHGLLTPIWTLDGMILDGRNRWNACKELGIRPGYKAYQGADSLGFVVSMNLKRRHLNESQRAMVAARLAGMPPHRPKISAQICAVKSQPDAAKLLNVSRRSVQHAKQVLDSGDTALIGKVNSGKLKVSAATRELNRQEDTRQIENKTFPAVKGKFKTILVDPPWDYGNLSLAGRGHPEYAVMNLAELRKMDIQQYAETNCHLYLWATNNFLREALKIGVVWGFGYKTVITWVKPSIGLGSYFRNSTEQLLFFVKGNLPTRAKNIPTHFMAQRGEHSAKPDEAYRIIEAASYPARLELFGRKKREDWTVHGHVLHSATGV